ncbi:YadA-like family protein [Dryocola sp. LX212]
MNRRKIAFAIFAIVAASTSAHASLNTRDKAAFDAYLSAHPGIQQYDHWKIDQLNQLNSLTEVNNQLSSYTYYDQHLGINVKPGQVPAYQPPTTSIPMTTITQPVGTTTPVAPANNSVVTMTTMTAASKANNVVDTNTGSHPPAATSAFGAQYLNAKNGTDDAGQQAAQKALTAQKYTAANSASQTSTTPSTFGAQYLNAKNGTDDTGQQAAQRALTTQKYAAANSGSQTSTTPSTYGNQYLNAKNEADNGIQQAAQRTLTTQKYAAANSGSQTSTTPSTYGNQYLNAKNEADNGIQQAAQRALTTQKYAATTAVSPLVASTPTTSETALDTANHVNSRLNAETAARTDSDKKLEKDIDRAKSTGEQAQHRADDAFASARKAEATGEHAQHRADEAFTTAQKAETTGEYAQSRADTAFAHAEANKQALAATNHRLAADDAELANHEQRIGTLESQTTSNFAKLKSQMDDNRKRASAGISGVAAMANIPQVTNTQDFSVGAGVGTADSESALAVGFSARATENVVVKASVSDDSQHNFVAGAGVAYGW